MYKNNLTDILADQWQQTLQPFDVEPTAMETAFTQLVAAYSAPDRHYHNLQHISHVLNIIQALQTYTENLRAVQLAAWFHDVIYDTQAQDNEEKSAEYANQSLSSLGIPVDQINTVTRLILNTKHHKAERDDLDSQVLLDADLAILAVTDQYREYAKAIRQEYSFLSLSEYVAARKQFLRQFLQRQQIYFTPLMLEFAELFARYNLNSEWQQLEQT